MQQLPMLHMHACSTSSLSVWRMCGLAQLLVTRAKIYVYTSGSLATEQDANIHSCTFVLPQLCCNIIAFSPITQVTVKVR